VPRSGLVGGNEFNQPTSVYINANKVSSALERHSNKWEKSGKFNSAGVGEVSYEFTQNGFRLKIFGKRRFNNFQDLPKSTENIVQTHDWRGFFANVPSENG
jgi:hypothetical protein